MTQQDWHEDERYMLARQEMVKYEEGTPEWLYWRGVAVGVESVLSHVSLYWFHAVLRANKAE